MQAAGRTRSPGRRIPPSRGNARESFQGRPGFRAAFFLGAIASPDRFDRGYDSEPLIGLLATNSDGCGGSLSCPATVMISICPVARTDLIALDVLK
jgi:hypothetical protein